MYLMQKQAKNKMVENKQLWICWLFKAFSISYLRKLWEHYLLLKYKWVMIIYSYNHPQKHLQVDWVG